MSCLSRLQIEESQPLVRVMQRLLVLASIEMRVTDRLVSGGPEQGIARRLRHGQDLACDLERRPESSS